MKYLLKGIGFIAMASGWLFLNLLCTIIYTIWNLRFYEGFWVIKFHTETEEVFEDLTIGVQKFKTLYEYITPIDYLRGKKDYSNSGQIIKINVYGDDYYP